MARYLTSAMEQALWSLLNVGINLLLIRVAAPDQYGAFAFWANCGFVLASLQNALTVPHFQALPPGARDSPERLGVERLMHAVTVVFLAVVAGLALAAALVWRAQGDVFGQPAAALFVPAFLLQQYVRALAFSRGAPKTALLQTGLALMLGGVLVAGLVVLGSHPGANEIMLLLGAAYGLVGLGGAWSAMRGQGVRISLTELADYRRYVVNSGWLFLGVTTTELLARFYAFAVAGAFGATVLASLAATQLLLRPTPLLASAWSMVARNDLARRAQADDAAGYARIIVLALVMGLAVAAVWGLLATCYWGDVSRILFKGKYAGDRALVALWGISAALSLSQVVISTGLQVKRAYKALAIANAVAAVFAATAIALLMRRIGFQGAVVGTALGQGVEVAIMGALLWRGLAGGRSGQPASAVKSSAAQIDIDPV